MIKYITLWEILMKVFQPDQLLLMGLIHGVMRLAGETNENSALSQKLKDDYFHDAEAAETLCNKLDLTLSKKAIQRIKELLSENSPKMKKILKLNQELENRIIDEMESRKFFFIEPDKVTLVNEKNLFGEKVTEAFPSAVVDIEEAGKCLVFERWTATVFHLMRVMEIGLKVLGNTLQLPESTNRTWEAILRKCDSELAKPVAQRSPEWASDDVFFSGATAMLRAVKNAWRNPTMHIEKVYTEEQAEDIWNAVKVFMRQLSAKLKE